MFSLPYIEANTLCCYGNYAMTQMECEQGECIVMLVDYWPKYIMQIRFVLVKVTEEREGKETWLDQKYSD